MATAVPPVRMDPFQNIFNVSWRSQNFLLVGSKVAGFTNRMQGSLDGKTWFNTGSPGGASNPFFISPISVAYGAGMWMSGAFQDFGGGNGAGLVFSKSTDGTKTWQAISAPWSGQFANIMIASLENCFFVTKIGFIPADEPKLLLTVDKGVTWTQINTPLAANKGANGIYELNGSLFLTENGAGGFDPDPDVHAANVYKGTLLKDDDGVVIGVTWVKSGEVFAGQTTDPLIARTWNRPGIAHTKFIVNENEPAVDRYVASGAIFKPHSDHDLTFSNPVLLVSTSGDGLTWGNHQIFYTIADGTSTYPGPIMAGDETFVIVASGYPADILNPDPPPTWLGASSPTQLTILTSEDRGVTWSRNVPPNAGELVNSDTSGTALPAVAAFSKSAKLPTADESGVFVAGANMDNGSIVSGRVWASADGITWVQATVNFDDAQITDLQTGAAKQQEVEA